MQEALQMNEKKHMLTYLKVYSQLYNDKKIVFRKYLHNRSEKIQFDRLAFSFEYIAAQK